jgi:selenide,water dikinase
VIVDVASVPVLDGVRDLAAAGVVPGGSGRNRAFVADRLDVGDGVDDLDVTVLADAQTSGGLVVGVDPDRVDELVADLAGSGHPVAVIGEAVAASPTGPGRLALR